MNRSVTGTSAFGLLAASVMLGACFPTLQTPRVEPGFRLDVGVTAIADQRRNGTPQGTDMMLYAGPAYGFGHRFEIGIPVGTYLEEATSADRYQRNFVIWPYLKLAMLEPASRHHLALIAQSALIAPANLGLRYGFDLGGWEPYGGVTAVFSGGPAGDDPFVTRFQEKDQSLWALVGGATWNVQGRPTIEIGVLRNRYQEGAVYGDFGQPTRGVTLYDLFVGAKIGVF